MTHPELALRTVDCIITLAGMYFCIWGICDILHGRKEVK